MGNSLNVNVLFNEMLFFHYRHIILLFNEILFLCSTGIILPFLYNNQAHFFLYTLFPVLQTYDNKKTHYIMKALVSSYNYICRGYLLFTHYVMHYVTFFTHYVTSSTAYVTITIQQVYLIYHIPHPYTK